MGEEMQSVQRDTGWKKAIREALDALQSRVLVAIVVPLLVAAAVIGAAQTIAAGGSLRPLAVAWALSFGFAALVWRLRSATLPGAGVGLLVCVILAHGSVIWAGSWTGFPAFLVDQVRPHAISALIALFLLTFAATRFGRAKKERRGVAEARTGRRASQIVANLGVAALCAAVGWYVGCIAALAEATADTVSSEIGQAVGGQAWMITTLRRVPAGRDGGVSVAGTVAGMVGAAVVVAVGMPHHALWPDKALVLGAAVAGLFFDSVLGATVEERGWLGNDLVNFGSTLFSALFAAALPWFWGLA